MFSIIRLEDLHEKIVMETMGMPKCLLFSS